MLVTSLLLLGACSSGGGAAAPGRETGLRGASQADTGGGAPGGGGPGGGPGGGGPGGGPGGAPPGADTADSAAPAGGDTAPGGSEPTWSGAPGEYALRYDDRDVWLYVPSAYDGTEALPLVIGFHGAGDSGRNFYAVTAAYGWTAAAESEGFALLIPSTKSPYSDFAIWSGNPNNDLDEMVAELDEVLAVADWLGESWRIDSEQIHAFGFSDGGLFAAVAGMSRSDRLSTLSILSYGWGAAWPLVTPARPIPVQFACGTSDSFYPYAEDSEAFLASQGLDTRLIPAPGVGHSFSGLMATARPEDLAGWMLAARP